MPFVYVTEPTFSHTVKVKVPVDGGFEDQSFKATFRVLEAETLAEHDRSTPEGSTNFLKNIVTGLDDIIGEDKQPIPYSEKLRDHLIQLSYTRRALHDAYFDGLNGGASGN